MTHLMDAKAKVVATLRLTEFVSYHWETSVPPYLMPLGPYIPLTDHEAALAELLAENARLVQVNEEAIRDLGNSLRERDALLTGLEALAGEIEIAAGHACATAQENWARSIRTLASAGLEGK